MSGYTSKAHKAMITQLMGITGADSSNARRHLQETGWNLEAACNKYLDGGVLAQRDSAGVNQAAIANLFDEYKDAGSDMMRAEGVANFCGDLKVDPADIIMLIISYHFQAQHSCEYTRQEFMAGMSTLGCDSVAKLRDKIPQLRLEAEEEDTFQEVYNYAYLFSREKGQKCVQLDMAIPMWQLVFSQRPWPLLPAWCEFLQKHHKCAISRDTWTQLLDFIKTIKPDLSNYDENASTSAWPYLLDDFVAYLKSTPNALPIGSDTAASEEDVVMID